jgi:hypothetical protein
MSKSILVPLKIGPYLGFRADSIHQAFRSILTKRDRFLQLARELLGKPKVTVRELQRLARKCVAFSLAVPAAKLFTREMNVAISRHIRSSRPFPLTDDLKDEISHWLFLDNWDEPLPGKDEIHIVVSMATDASNSGWGGVILSPISKKVSDYWVGEECNWDIATKEAMTINRMLLSNRDFLRDTRVDVHVNNQAVLQAWNNGDGAICLFRRSRTYSLPRWI